MSLASFMILMLLFGIVPFPVVLLLNLLDKGLMVSWGGG